MQRANNQDTDQPARPRRLISMLSIHFIDSTLVVPVVKALGLGEDKSRRNTITKQQSAHVQASWSQCDKKLVLMKTFSSVVLFNSLTVYLFDNIGHWPKLQTYTEHVYISNGVTFFMHLCSS